jgi:hypothetical protein
MEESMFEAYLRKPDPLWCFEVGIKKAAARLDVGVCRAWPEHRFLKPCRPTKTSERKIGGPLKGGLEKVSFIDKAGTVEVGGVHEFRATEVRLLRENGMAKAGVSAELGARKAGISHELGSAERGVPVERSGMKDPIPCEGGMREVSIKCEVDTVKVRVLCEFGVAEIGFLGEFGVHESARRLEFATLVVRAGKNKSDEVSYPLASFVQNAVEFGLKLSIALIGIVRMHEAQRLLVNLRRGGVYKPSTRSGAGQGAIGAEAFLA